MAKNNTNTKQGFTIIEVVLVLAIAGLIFLMVFIAWPALQRSQRDTQRRNDYSMLSTAISNFATNNNGKLANLIPSGNTKTLDAKTYINEAGEDPDGHAYVLTAVKCGSTSTTAVCPLTGAPNLSSGKPKEFNVYVVLNADCSKTHTNGFAAPTYNSSSRAFAIFGYLEGGTQTFCSASQ